jgi:hypothetical protein
MVSLEIVQMDLISLYWLSDRGEDIHMTRRSSSIPMAEWLRVSSTDPANPGNSDLSLTDFLSAYGDAECIFKPTFPATLNPSTGDYEGFGVTVNSRSGLISVGPNPTSQPLYNFTVIATLVANRNDPASKRLRTFLRIHLHNYVAKAWLSPASLRVPKGISGFRFAVLAQFDDKTIGRLQMSNVIDWFSDPPNAGVDNNNGFITLGNSTADDTPIGVEAVLNVDFQDSSGGTITARGTIIPYTLPQVARLLPNSAGYDRRNEVPNFIFLADGFQAADQPRFNAMIDFFMRDLRQNEKFKPFDHLLGSMNFWKVFVPSTARGVGTKFEVYGDERAQPASGLDWIFELENDSPMSEDDLNSDTWGPNQIRLYFGLPLLMHKNMSNEDIKDYWKDISYLPDALIDLVPGNLINDWKKQGDRRVVDESDTFIGTYYGSPTRGQAAPRDDRTLRKALYRINEERFTRLRLNRFLMNLQYQDENGVLHPLGAVWDMFGNGKDFDNVIILLCANSGRVLNESGDLFVNIIDKGRDYIGIEANAAVNTGFPDGRAVKMSNLGTLRIPAILPLMPAQTTLLHEIAHSLGLDDEYGERGISKDDPRLVYTGSGSIDQDRHYSNTQVKSDLVISPGSEDIDVRKIKWRWHRIEKSGVLAPLAPPDPHAITKNGNQYTIKLQKGHAARFVEGDIVILRYRKMGQSILQDIEYSQISARYPFVTRSPEFSVMNVNAPADQLILEPVEAAALTGRDLAADFQAECVLYVPQLARYYYEPTGENLEVIAANILEFMAGTQRPLHENLDSLGQPELDFDGEQDPDLTDPNLAAIMGISGCAKKNRDIVGLYAGGRSYHHGVYHATGHCIMRDNREIAEFCAVCKYILTDFIDPSLHAVIDKQYEKHYPLKSHI